MTSTTETSAEAPSLDTSFGERFVFRATAAETDGQLLRMDTFLDAGGGVRRPLHAHPKQEERFIIHDGVLGLSTDGDEQFLEAGEEATVTTGTPHTFWNGSDEPLHMTTEHRPALRFEEFIRAMVQLDREDGLNDEGMPANPFVAAMLITEFNDEMQPSDIPVPVQRVLFPTLSVVGRVLGYRPPQYTAEQSATHD
jgi:mannose-6-phosphate isomerase-like protein (cupin superfamily)